MTEIVFGKFLKDIVIIANKTVKYKHDCIQNNESAVGFYENSCVFRKKSIYFKHENVCGNVQVIETRVILYGK